QVMGLSLLSSFSMLAQLLLHPHTVEVAGSNPAARMPTRRSATVSRWKSDSNPSSFLGSNDARVPVSNRDCRRDLVRLSSGARTKCGSLNGREHELPWTFGDSRSA